MYLNLILTLCTLFSFFSLWSQPSQIEIKGGVSDERPSGLFALPNGESFNTFITKSSTFGNDDIVLEKMDNSFQVVDTIRIGGSTRDFLYDMLIDNDTLYLLGFSGPQQKAMVVKMLNNGTIIWQNLYHIQGFRSGFNWGKLVNDTLICGGSLLNGSTWKPIISAIDKRSGAPFNNFRFQSCGSCNEFINPIFPSNLGSNSVYFFSFNYNNISNDPHTLAFIHLNFSGNVLNSYNYTGAFGIPRGSLTLPSDSIFLLASRTPATGRSTRTNLLSKHGPTGEVSWAKHFFESGSSAEIEFWYFQQDNDKLIFTGQISGHISAVGGRDLIIMRTDTLGNFNWAKIIGGAGTDIGYQVNPISNGYRITGQTNSTGAGGNDLLTITTDKDGNILSNTPCFQIINFMASDSLVPMSQSTTAFSVTTDITSSNISLGTAGITGISIDACSVLEPQEVEGSNSVPKIISEDISLFYKPSRKSMFVNVNSSIDIKFTLQVLDIKGKKILNRHFYQSTNQRELEIRVPELSQGIYLVQVTKENGESCSKKIWIQ